MSCLGGRQGAHLTPMGRFPCVRVKEAGSAVGRGSRVLPGSEDDPWSDYGSLTILSIDLQWQKTVPGPGFWRPIIKKCYLI